MAATSPSSPPPIAPCSSRPAAAALGLFTAIRRLQAVHARIAPELEAAGIPLYAQHVDAMGNATWSTSSAPRKRAACSAPTRCGTASTCRAAHCVWWCSRRSPGRALTFCIENGGSICRTAIRRAIDDRIARLRLRQAFGRLIRRASDRGVFVLLDRQTPSRLLSAFPAGVAVRRVGLAEAVKQTRAFLGEPLPA